MATDAKKTAARFQISMPRVTSDRLDIYLAKIGMSRSSYISLLVGQALQHQDVMNEVLTQQMAKFIQQTATKYENSKTE